MSSQLVDAIDTPGLVNVIYCVSRRRLYVTRESTYVQLYEGGSRFPLVYGDDGGGAPNQTNRGDDPVHGDLAFVLLYATACCHLNRSARVLYYTDSLHLSTNVHHGELNQARRV